MKRTEILISGFGGQGVVRLGRILSTAAVHEGLYTTMLISHGTETRGGYVRSQIVVSDEPIDSPVVEAPDYFCAMSKSAYSKFSDLVDQGIILFDPAYIDQINDQGVKHVALSARDLATEKLGGEIFSNIIFLGALGQYLKEWIHKETILRAIQEILPKFTEKNKQAFEIGYAALDIEPHYFL